MEQATLKIVCPYDYSRKRFGLFPDGCPNLLWELMRTRREQLSAAQLMRKNPSEALVDKDNHLRDALKYILLSLPGPSEPPPELERQKIIRATHMTTAAMPRSVFACSSTMQSTAPRLNLCPIVRWCCVLSRRFTCVLSKAQIPSVVE